MSIIFTDLELTLDSSDVLKGQGIDPQRARERLVSQAESVIDEALSLAEPKAMYVKKKVLGYEHQVISMDGGQFKGSLPAKAMAGADDLCVGICTIGPRLEKRVEELMADDPLRAVALDGAGIAALRKVSEAVEDIISSEACKEDVKLGMRAQPGQEGWGIEQQRVVFQLLPAAEIGMSLTESCLMLPRKSVSFVIPRGNNLDNSQVPCDFCTKRSRCEWRKDKAQAG